MAGNIERIDAAVQAVVGKLMRDVNSPPTDLEAFGRLVNVRRFVAEPLPISGELRREDGGLIVAYSSYLNPGRRKFTIAHELAHAIFETSGPNCPRSGKELERLCDMIATEILMPKGAFLAKCGTKEALSWDKIAELSKVFQTSLSATSIRCAELLGVTVFEVEEDSISWAFGAVRRGPIAKLDGPLRNTIANARRRDVYDDRVYASMEATPQAWWEFKSKSVTSGKRHMILMRHLGQYADDEEAMIPKAADWIDFP